MHPGSVGTAQEYRFLPLSPEKVTAQPLPPIFNFRGFKIDRVVKAFVQYYLRAELQPPGQLQSPVIVTTLPLEVEHVYPGPPTIADFKLKRQTMSRNITSSRLIPGMEDIEPSFAQKAQKLVTL
jgi:hypothetical protein